MCTRITKVPKLNIKMLSQLGIRIMHYGNVVMQKNIPQMGDKVLKNGLVV